MNLNSVNYKQQKRWHGTEISIHNFRNFFPLNFVAHLIAIASIHYVEDVDGSYNDVNKRKENFARLPYDWLMTPTRKYVSYQEPITAAVMHYF